jgi:hypothetical protein
MKNDEEVVKRFLNRAPIRIVAGGTTAKIVARYLQENINVQLTYEDSEVPPIGSIKGIDLVTEGMLTLTKAAEKLQKVKNSGQLSDKTDGATRLAKLLLDADDIHIIIGTAVNPAHHNPDLPYQLGIKSQVIEKIAALLAETGKKVTLERY